MKLIGEVSLTHSNPIPRRPHLTPSLVTRLAITHMSPHICGGGQSRPGQEVTAVIPPSSHALQHVHIRTTNTYMRQYCKNCNYNYSVSCVKYSISYTCNSLSHNCPVKRGGQSHKHNSVSNVPPFSQDSKQSTSINMGECNVVTGQGHKYVSIVYVCLLLTMLTCSVASHYYVLHMIAVALSDVCMAAE